MKTNTKARFAEKTHEGAQAAHMTPTQALRRSVLSALLWEDEFYEDGVEIAKRVHELAEQVPVAVLADLAVEARTRFHMRHMPLWLLIPLIKRGSGSRIVSEAIAGSILRADELAELLALYWKVNGQDAPLSAQLKLGLAKAFKRFDAYALAKYDRDGAVKLRDALFLSHAKPKDETQAATFKALAERKLETPDTWEVALSGGADKRETFERLIRQGDLGYLALLRNLRNMAQAGCDHLLVTSAIMERKGAERVLPFRYIAAAKHAPEFEASLDLALQASFADGPKLAGRTIIVLDVSGSMQAQLSGRSEMTRLDAGAALAAVIRGACDDVAVYATAGNDGTRIHKTAKVPARSGMALRDALTAQIGYLGGGGIFLKPMLAHIEDHERAPAARVIVITDEQDCAVDSKDSPLLAKPFGTEANYLINVASNKNGVGYGKWTHIDGMSEAVVSYIVEHERRQA